MPLPPVDAVAEAEAASGDAEFAMMLLADGRWLAGGHTQSGGLEPALNAGMTSADVPAYLRTRLRTVTTVEAGVAVVALHRLRRGLPLHDVEQAWGARTPSEGLRGASVTMGRGYLRLLRRLWPDHPVTLAVTGSEPRSRAVAVAGAAAILGLTPAQLARLVCYEDVQTVASAALKLAPLDPADTAAWTVNMRHEVAEVIARVAWLTEPDDIPAVAAPLIEQWAQAHAASSRRLFSA